MSSSTALTTNDDTGSLVALFGDLTTLSNYVYKHDTTALICGESWDRTGQDGVLKVSHVSVPVTIEGRDGKVRLTDSSAREVMQEFGRLAQDLMSSSDPEYGRKGLDMSLAQRRY
ncbi:hypothetical protein EHS25_008388 [Saitozyma podzolica]|uniref:Uncharacterized protein n=1 Tax=Saitozyma podzolica TaxID=1890683 RepID=A0A427YPA6_9TREE|nr:hypothetical protein EHS25_008388 [Saitozyma podzolica]